MSRRIAAEYSDEVSKLNKKEDLLLERKLRVFDRQEKVAQNTLKRSINDVERFRLSLESDKCTPNLSVLERQKELAKAFQYGVPSAGRSTNEGLLFNKRKLYSLEGRKHESKPARLPPLNGSGNRKALAMGQALIPAPLSSLNSPRFKGRHRRVPEFALQLKTLEDIVKGSRADGQNSKWQYLLDGPGSRHHVENGKVLVALPSEKDTKTDTEEWVAASLKEVRMESPMTVCHATRDMLIRSQTAKSHSSHVMAHRSELPGSCPKGGSYTLGSVMDKPIAYKSEIDEHKVNSILPSTTSVNHCNGNSNLTVSP